MKLSCALGFHRLETRKKTFIVFTGVKNTVVKAFYDGCSKTNCKYVEDRWYVQSMGFMTRKEIDGMVNTYRMHPVKKTRGAK